MGPLPPRTALRSPSHGKIHGDDGVAGESQVAQPDQPVGPREGGDLGHANRAGRHLRVRAGFNAAAVRGPKEGGRSAPFLPAKEDGTFPSGDSRAVLRPGDAPGPSLQDPQTAEPPARSTCPFRPRRQTGLVRETVKASGNSPCGPAGASLQPPGQEEEEDDCLLKCPVCLQELPAVEDVSVSLPEDSELQPVGTVSSIVQQLVIIQSLKDTPPLNEDSILFRCDRVAVGKVFEVFGPVCSPLYVLRFNSADQIISKGLTEGSTVYCAPALKEYTDYILTQQLKLLKGSDASWKNDDEPPEEVIIVNVRISFGALLPFWMFGGCVCTTENVFYHKSGQHQGHDRRGFQSRHAGPRVQRQHPRNAPPQHFHSYCPPGHTETHPSYRPPHSHYLPSPSHPPPRHPFSPPSFPLYPPPPLPPPAFFNPSFSPPFWPPNSVPYVDFTLPPPPPPPPLPPSPPH
uniref:H/ACA ribonucleoprotein complex non-core subunit NAF1 n=1 Tax=Fundulus heteroclitus TaxID=8078 RepID=A0A3Q2PLZ2_FUNHE